MNRAEALRDLYEALDMLDARQVDSMPWSTASVATEPDPFTVDLRDADGGLLARDLGRPLPRVSYGADWERGAARW